MRTLFIYMRLFTFAQEILMFEDGKEIERETVPMNIFEDSVVCLARLNKITEVTIAGPKVYTKGIQKKIEKAELKTYNKNLLNIKLI